MTNQVSTGSRRSELDPFLRRLTGQRVEIVHYRRVGEVPKLFHFVVGEIPAKLFTHLVVAKVFTQPVSLQHDAVSLERQQWLSSENFALKV